MWAAAWIWTWCGPRQSSPEPRPAVLLVHGGGFRAGTRQSYLPMAAKLAERGYVAATVTYRWLPAISFPRPFMM
jgi:Esterase/lipase